jgi:hypothetical protein
VITVICIWPLDNQDEAHDQLSEDDAGDIVDETINEAIAIKKKPSEKVDYMFLRVMILFICHCIL